VAAADRLLRRVDSLQRAMDVTDTLALTHLEGLFAAERTYIEARFQDTLDAGTATALGNYHRAMAQALPHALDERRRLRRRIDSTRARLAALHHDLQLALMPREEEAAVLDREQRGLAALDTALAAVDARIASARRDHDRHRPAIDSLLNATAP
jgi:hypothetical protein